ncbi:MAG: hypothetical protein MJD61_18640 [Proteobacteria bacterium]|nr:hypothetical protein [Pseudomonadota bacterium]
MATVRFHPAARAELVDAIVYHERERPGYGAKLEGEVEELLERASTFPQAAAPLDAYPPEFEVRALRLHTFPYSFIIACVNGERTVYAFAPRQAARP